MEITFEVTLDYGEEGPNEGEASPTTDDISAALMDGLNRRGFRSVDVTATQL